MALEDNKKLIQSVKKCSNQTKDKYKEKIKHYCNTRQINISELSSILMLNNQQHHTLYNYLENDGLLDGELIIKMKYFLLSNPDSTYLCILDVLVSKRKKYSLLYLYLNMIAIDRQMALDDLLRMFNISANDLRNNKISNLPVETLHNLREILHLKRYEINHLYLISMNKLIN